jgi:hypothetical protein
VTAVGVEQEVKKLSFVLEAVIQIIEFLTARMNINVCCPNWVSKSFRFWIGWG